jgi:hypothetical protein
VGRARTRSRPDAEGRLGPTSAGGSPFRVFGPTSCVISIQGWWEASVDDLKGQTLINSTWYQRFNLCRYDSTAILPKSVWENVLVNPYQDFLSGEILHLSSFQD